MSNPKSKSSGRGKPGSGRGRGGNPKKNIKSKPNSQNKTAPSTSGIKQTQPGNPAKPSNSANSAKSTKSTNSSNSEKPSKPSKTSKPVTPSKATDPPLECTHAEFTALLGDARGLSSFREAGEELLDCARYGEVDACRAILDVWGNQSDSQSEGKNDSDGSGGSGDSNTPTSKREQNTQTTQTAQSAQSAHSVNNVHVVNYQDSSSSTPLHKASANGHASTVQLLLSRGANHTPNDHGNTPLHWAAGAGHSKVVRLLLGHFDALALEKLEMSERLEAKDAASNAASSAAANTANSANAAKNVSATSTPSTTSAIDVLLKNNFGRSALTEGFASGDTPTVEAMLNHDSAEEERLIGGINKEEVDDDDVDDVDGELDEDAVGAELEESGIGGTATTKGGKKKEPKSVVHEFDFLRGSEGSPTDDDHAKSVLIRELPIAHADDPFGQAPIEDTTGLGIWCASLVMARWMASPPMVERMRNKRILELGAGCGIPGLTAAVYGTPKSVNITDLNPQTIENIHHNIQLNNLSETASDSTNNTNNTNNTNDANNTNNTNNTNNRCITTGSSIDWGDESTYPPEKIDYVICSDCIYQKDIVPLLKKVVTGLLDKGRDSLDGTTKGDGGKSEGGESKQSGESGSFFYVAPEGGRDGLPEFIAAMKTEGFTCVKEEVAPESYKENPLKSGDEEDCFLHFHELMSTVYVLYEFRRC